VLTTGDPIRITPEGEQEIARVRGEATTLAGSDLALEELVARLDALAEQLRTIVDTETRLVGRPARQVDLARAC
jgi:hypothetical protein